MARLRSFANIIDPEECRVPVGRPDFKSGRGCQQSLVGSTPILFRQDNAASSWQFRRFVPAACLRTRGVAGPLVLPSQYEGR